MCSPKFYATNCLNRLIPIPPFLIPNSSFLIFPIPNSSFLIPHSPRDSFPWNTALLFQIISIVGMKIVEN